jgi:AraC-like DNA-binding protein
MTGHASSAVRIAPPVWYGVAGSWRTTVNRATVLRLRRTGGKGAEWWVTLAGRATCDVAGRRVVLLPGVAVMLAPGEAGPTRVEAGRAGWDGVRIVFAGAPANEFMRYLVRRFGRVHSLDQQAAPVRHALALHHDPGDREPPDAAHELRVFRWLHGWLEHLEACTPPLRAIYTLSRDDDRLAAVAAQPLKTLAGELGCSVSTLRRRLQAAWGRRPGEVVRRARLREAQRLLRPGGPPTQGVGARVGYTREASFAAAFRNEFGMTPAEYRIRQTVGLAALPLAPLPAPVFRPQVRSDATDPIQARSPDWHGPFFQPFMCGMTTTETEEAFDLSLTANRHACWVITLEGRAELESGGQRLTVTPGTVVAYHSPLNARWRTRPGSRWRRLWLQMRGDLANQYLEFLIARYGSVFRLDRRGRMLRAARHLVTLVRTGKVRTAREWSVAAFGWLHTCHAELERRGVDPVDRRELAGQASAPLGGRVRSLTDYARKMGYSRSYLSRRLSRQWRKSPAYVLRTGRLERAAELLRTTRLPVSQIAKEALYRSQAAFINAFKRVHGRTPSVYRREVAG